MRILDHQLSEQWQTLLEEELGHQREQLAVAQAITTALVQAREAEFTRLTARQQRQVEAGRSLQQRREQLRRRSAEVLGVATDGLRMASLLPALDAAVRCRCQEVQEELRQVARENHRLADRNGLLIRTTLSIVQECIDVVAGPRVGDGYQRNGVAVNRHSRSGSLVDLAG